MLAEADAIGQKGGNSAAADLEAGGAQAATPVVTEAKSRWLASRLARMVTSKPAARSSVDSSTQPQAAVSTAGLAAETQNGADAVRRSVEMPVLQHSSDGTPAATSTQRTPFQEAVVQGATRSERIDALTEHPADGADGGEASQSVTLISAVETEDGRLVVDSVAAAGDSAQSREAAEARGAAALPAAATAGGVAAVSTVDGAGSGSALSQASGDVAAPRRRGILQRLRLRPPPNVVSTDVLPADVP